MVKKIAKVVDIKKAKITRETIEKKVSELYEMIDNFDGHKCDAAEYACYQIVTAAVDNHYEGLGILQETLLLWREESLKALQEEEN